MSVFESTLQTLLAHTETLGLNEGDYLQVCNAMKEVFQKKPEEKKIQHQIIDTSDKSIKMKGYIFQHLESRAVHYVGPVPSDFTVRCRLTNPKGITTESTHKDVWSGYIQSMIRFLAPDAVEQTYCGITEKTTFKQFMKDMLESDILDAACEKAYRASDGYDGSHDDDDNLWRGEYHRERFWQQYRVL